MTLYLLLNLALIILAAGVIPVFASAEGDPPDPGAQKSASAAARAARRKEREEQSLLNKLLDESVEKLREEVQQRIEINEVLDVTKTSSEQRLGRLQEELRTLKGILKEAIRVKGVEDERVKALQSQIELLTKQEKALVTSTNAANRFGESFDKLLGLSDSWNNSMVGGLLEAFDAGRGFEGVMKENQGTFDDYTTEWSQVVLQNMKDQRERNVSFEAMTGQIETEAQKMVDAIDSIDRAGIIGQEEIDKIRNRYMCTG